MFKKSLVLICASFSIITSLLSASYAEQNKQLDSNEVITEYGKIATGLALEERCLLLFPLETREYYWHQYLLDFSLSKIFTGSPVLTMIRGTAHQTSKDERFKCDQESLDFIQSSLQKARDLNFKLTGKVFEQNVSDHAFDEQRITIIAAAAGTNAVCKHLLPEYEEQLRVGYEALTNAMKMRYPENPDTSRIKTSYTEATNQEKTSCNKQTNQQALQGWQLTRLLMQQFRLAFATKKP